MSQLIIEDVDLEQLEQQRKVLIRVLHTCRSGRLPAAGDLEYLEGLEGMLTTWSDAQWREAGCPESETIDEEETGDGMEHEFHVTVTGCTRDQARTVMQERIYPDENYGFEYHIDFKESDP